jgi:hypothetical protein
MRALAMRPKVLEALLRLADRGNVTGWHPPQSIVRAVESLEPRPALPHHFDVRAPVDEVAKPLGTLPDR